MGLEASRQARLAARVVRLLPDWARRGSLRHMHGARARRGPATHVVVLDGTLSCLEPGMETNAGLTYKLLAEAGPRAGLSLWYEAGLQWHDWSETPHVMMGRGLNRQIRRAYGFLASRYRPGDRIFLFGYSRGAFAARSLAGAIDRVGLLRPEHATVRNVRQAYHHYRRGGQSDCACAFRTAHCHDRVEIEMIGAWDTVKALGLRLPLLWRLTEAEHAFHNHALSPIVRRGFHALAHDETRLVFAPEMWQTAPDHPGRLEQRWFPGAHGDVGGHLMGFEAARPLANVSLRWMLEQAANAGLALPSGWPARFPADPEGPSVGTFRGWGKVFVLRGRRPMGRDPSESFHPAIAPPVPDAAPAL